MQNCTFPPPLPLHHLSKERKKKMKRTAHKRQFYGVTDGEVAVAVVSAAVILPQQRTLRGLLAVVPLQVYRAVGRGGSGGPFVAGVAAWATPREAPNLPRRKLVTEA